VKALNGERQLVFVTGEPGIGKTTLVDVFVAGVRRPASNEESQNAKVKGQKSKLTNPQPLTRNPQIGRGQCIEHYGAGEAYLPILEALGRLCREPDGEWLIEMLQQHAPSWLVQMPALLDHEELEALQRKTIGVTRERMLRELAEALEVITAERSLVLVLEDLHWSDVSTLDLLSMLARRQEQARLLVIGTYRPVEVLTRDHPLKGSKQELQLHGQCEELALDFLSETAVGEYLMRRIEIETERKQDRPFAEVHDLQDTTGVLQLARLVHCRTDGNPLFMVNVTNELIVGGGELRNVVSLQSLEDLGVGVPENLRQLIEQQLARVSPDERKILEAASVAGAEFSAATVTAGTEQSTEDVETHCDNLVRRELFLRPRETSEWPDGTIAACYGFVHALYQEVLYDQLAASRRVRLHQQIGERVEHAYGERAKEIAAELAVHFERGRDYRKAVRYLQQAGENAALGSSGGDRSVH
jgi:predicted ATPase